MEINDDMYLLDPDFDNIDTSDICIDIDIEIEYE